MSIKKSGNFLMAERVYSLCKFTLILWILNVCHVGKIPIRTHFPSPGVWLKARVLVCHAWVPRFHSLHCKWTEIIIFQSFKLLMQCTYRWPPISAQPTRPSNYLQSPEFCFSNQLLHFLMRKGWSQIDNDWNLTTLICKFLKSFNRCILWIKTTN